MENANPPFTLPCIASCTLARHERTAMANLWPIHMRAPTPKGMCAWGGTSPFTKLWERWRAGVETLHFKHRKPETRIRRSLSPLSFLAGHMTAG